MPYTPIAYAAPLATRTYSGEYIFTKGTFNRAYQFLGNLAVTAAAGSSPTLDVTVQQSLDSGLTWSSFLAFTQATGATTQTLTEQDATHAAFSGDLKIAWAIGGGSSHGVLTVDPAGTQNKYTVTGKSVTPSTDNATTWTVVEGSPGDAISVALSGTDITVTLAVATAVRALLSTNLTGLQNDLTFQAKTGGTAGNAYHIVYDNSAAAAVTSVATSDNLTFTVTLRTTISTATMAATTMIGSDNDIQGVAAVASTPGNSVTLTLVDPAGNNQSLSISVVGSAITAHLATGVAGAITTTANQLLAALAASAPATALATFSLAQALGTGIVTALGAQSFSGGGPKTIVATADEVRLALQRFPAWESVITTDFKSGNDGTGVVTALSTTPLATGAAAAVTSTTGNVITAVAAHAGANALVGVTNFAGNDGTGLCASQATTNLSNGASFTWSLGGFAK